MAVQPDTADTPVLLECILKASVLPMERMFAEQQAMMDRIMADVNAMFARAMPPNGMIDAMRRQSGVPAYRHHGGHAWNVP